MATSACLPGAAAGVSPASAGPQSGEPLLTSQSATLRLAVTRCLWVCVSVFVCAILGGPFVQVLRPGADKATDFFQDWASARNLVHGMPVYTDQHITWGMYTGQGETAELPAWAEVNAHPPTSVLLALPLAALNYPDAVLTWNLISLAALVISLVMVIRQTGMPFTPWSVPPLLTFLLLCIPVWIHVTFGQLGLVLLLLITGAWAAQRSGRDSLAGVLLGTAMAVKLFPGFLFLWFVLRRRWRAVGAGALTLAALTLLSVGVLGWETYQSYVRDVLPKISWFRAAWNNASIPSFWSKLFDPASEMARTLWLTRPAWQNASLARAGSLAACAAITALTGLAILRARSRAECDRAFGLTIIAMLLVSPITWEHYFVLLLLPLALGWAAFPKSAPARAVFLGVQVALFFIAPAELHELVIPGGAKAGVANPVHTLTVLSFQLYALLGLFTLEFVSAVSRAKADGVSAA